MHIAFLNRRFAATMLILCGVLIAAGFYATPWESADADQAGYLQSLLDSPDQAQVAAFLLHLGYGLIAPMALGLVALTRPSRLRTIAGTLAIVGGITLSGAVLVDWTDLAAAQTVGIERAVEISERGQEYGGAIAFMVPGLLGMVVGLPLLAFAAWRSGAVPGFLPLALVAGNVAMFALRGPGSMIGATIFCGALVATGILSSGKVGLRPWATRTASATT